MKQPPENNSISFCGMLEKSKAAGAGNTARPLTRNAPNSEEGRDMAAKGQYGDSTPKSNLENWKSIGDLAALIVRRAVK